MRYAQNTEVAWETTRLEIERTLGRYRCTKFGYMTAERSALIAFVYRKTPYRLELPMPDPKSKEIVYKPNGTQRTDQQRLKEYQQEVRRRWRVLLLLVKAKLEAVEIGNTTMEREFLADLVLPGGRTVGAWASEQLGPAIEAGQMPANILALPEAKAV